MFPRLTYGSSSGIQWPPRPQEGATPARPSHNVAWLPEHDITSGVNPAVAPAKPRNACMPQEREELPPGWLPFLFPEPFRTTETINQNSGLVHSHAPSDQGRERRLPERPVVVHQANSTIMTPNKTFLTAPLNRTIPHSRDATLIEYLADYDILYDKDGSGYSHRE